MLHLLIKIFNKLPPSFRLAIKNTLQPFTLEMNSIKTLINDLRLPFYAISEPDGLKVAYIGGGSLIPYLKDCILDKDGNVELERKIFIGNLERELFHLSQKYEILLCYLHPFYLGRYFSNLFIRIPSFVRQTLDLPNNRSELHEKIKTRETKKDMNKIMHNGFYPEITKDKNFFNYFYKEFYRPYIASRHRDHAYILPFEDLVTKLEEGELLMVKQANQYVSGVLCRKCGDIYETICSGVYQGNWDLVQNGALTAEYLFSMERAIDLGCKSIDFGPARAFLNDGILLFKKKWNTHTSIDYRNTRNIGLHINKLNERTYRFLEKNPFLSVSGRKLIGTFFLGENTNLSDKELQSYIKYRRFKGVDSMIIVLLSESWIGRKAMLQKMSKTMTEDIRIIEYPQGSGSNFVTLTNKSSK